MLYVTNQGVGIWFVVDEIGKKSGSSHEWSVDILNNLKVSNNLLCGFAMKIVW